VKALSSLLCCLFALSTAFSHENATLGILARDTELPITLNGKKVGALTLKAGAEITILHMDKNQGTITIQCGDNPPVEIPQENIATTSLNNFLKASTLAPTTQIAQQPINFTNPVQSQPVPSPTSPSTILNGSSEGYQGAITEKTLLNTNFWDHPPLIPWNILNGLDTKKSYSTRNPIEIFNVPTEEIRITTTTKNGKETIQQVQATLAEFGNNTQTITWKPNISQATKDRDIQMRANRWPVIYQNKLQVVEHYLEKNFGESKQIILGTYATTREIESQYKTPDGQFLINLLTGNPHLIEITITRKTACEEATTTPQTRKEELEKRIQTNCIGDKFVDVPMLDQGQRGYCGAGTLAMLSQYYGYNTSLDEVATHNATWDDVRYTICTLCHLRSNYVDAPISFPIIKENINKGQPIIISRWVGPQKTGGHSSLITGYNDTTKEVLLTESWGEGARNHKMKITELQATMWAFFTFEPY